MKSQERANVVSANKKNLLTTFALNLDLFNIFLNMPQISLGGRP